VHGRPSFVVASAETLAYAIAAGEIGDPRLFKRPVRVTVPRVLPTDDVLIVRERRADGVPAKRVSTTAFSTSANGARGVWSGGQAVELVDGATFVVDSVAASGRSNLAVLCSSLDQVRHLALHASELSGHVQAVLAPFIPSGLVALLSGSGIAALQLDAAGLKGLRDEKSLLLPASARWAVETTATVVPAGKSKIPLTWLASSVERAWAGVGTARPAAKEAKTVRGA
jgi:aconitate hydratase